MNAKNRKQLCPPATLGIIGGGQLGKMITFEAKRMGYNVIVLDPKYNAPAGQVADEQILGKFDDIEALRELARKSEVLTYEFEHINVELLQKIEEEGFTVIPSSATLKVIQNKYVQKSMLQKIGVAVPEFYPVHSFDELKQAFQKLGGRMILKTCTDGYDGKGNIILHNADELQEAYQRFSTHEVMVEEFVDYVKELSILIAVNENGIEYYPVAENHHKSSILIKSIIPAEISQEVEKEIQAVGKKIVEEFNDYGLFCIEFFLDAAGRVLVNEIAPRPHNSGHYSIEACISSQYEQLVRIICGLPLGSSKLRAPSVMYNLLGSEHVTGSYQLKGVDQMLSLPGCYLHLYGKAETQDLKKLGHITAIAESVTQADEKAKKALQYLVLEKRKE